MMCHAVVQGAIYGMAQAIPDRSLVTEISRGFLDCLYSTEMRDSNSSNHMNGKDHWGGNGPASLVHTGKYNPPQSSRLIAQQLPFHVRWCGNHVIEAQTETEKLLFPNMSWHFDSVSYSFSFHLQPVPHAFVCCTRPTFQTEASLVLHPDHWKHAVLPSSVA